MKAGEIIGGRFVVEALAGAGGMGAVYRARDAATDRPVAIKVLAEHGPASRFEQEARLLAELDHPGVVRYVAHGRTDAHRPYLVMEWLEGEDLRARLSRDAMSISDAIALGRRVAEALAVAHARGIVHRDIKPANLFLPGGDPARVTVLDFGIARARAQAPFDASAQSITRTGIVVGTVGYMSPEQARGAPDIDPRTDVFALGCVLFECLTGRPAFVGANVVAVLARVLLEDPPRARRHLPQLPAALDDLIAQMLAKDPAARPRDAAAVFRLLGAVDTPRSSTSSGGLGEREQRIVTIVLARGLDAAAARVLAEGDPIELANGTTLSSSAVPIRRPAPPRAPCRSSRRNPPRWWRSRPGAPRASTRTGRSSIGSRRSPRGAARSSSTTSRRRSSEIDSRSRTAFSSGRRGWLRVHARSSVERPPASGATRSSLCSKRRSASARESRSRAASW